MSISTRPALKSWNRCMHSPDKKGRALCLRPEGRKRIQLAADKYQQAQGREVVAFLKDAGDTKDCRRKRYREFYQLVPKDQPFISQSTDELGVSFFG